MNKKIILTGDRPTGRLHLGHYVGSLLNRVKLQDQYKTFILIADYQALTDNFDNPKKVYENVRQLAIDYLSIGIDPQKVSIVIQSQIPELYELTAIYMNLVTLARAKRNPTIKVEMSEKKFGLNVPLGFLTYPISQAADITGFGADLVPVGEDQIPMIEQTNEIVKTFNRLYGPTLKECSPLIGDVPRLVGTDGNSKMSKSLNNFITLSETTESLRKKVFGMYTDPNRITATTPGKVEGNPVFAYLDVFDNDHNLIEGFKERYRKGTIGDMEIKERLFKVLNELLEPIREKRLWLENNPEYVNGVLKEGTEKGREQVKKTIASTRKAIGLADYFK